MKFRSDRPLPNLLADRFREFFREPGVVFWTFGFPIMLAVILSLAFRERANSAAPQGALGAERYIDFLLPGLVGMTLLSGGTWGVGYGLVLMRTRKLLKRLAATPMRRSDFLLAFVLFRLVLGGIEACVLFGLGHLFFGTSVRGSFAALAAVCLVGALSFAGLGLLCGSRAQNPQTGNGWVNAATLPMFLVSGVFFPAQNFPSWLQPLIQALPLTALNDALRAVATGGATLADVTTPVLVLGGWCAVTFGVALRVFRWS